MPAGSQWLTHTATHTLSRTDTQMSSTTSPPDHPRAAPQESGDVTVSRNVRVAYVEQEPTLPAGSTAADFVYRADAPAMSALREFNAAAEEASGAVEGEEAEAAAARLH